MGIMLSVETLRRYRFFAELDHASLTTLAMAGEVVLVKKGDWLFQEDDHAQALCLVLHGAVEIRIGLDAMRTRHAVVCSLGKGDIFGWSSLIEPYIYRSGAFASTDARVARVGGLLFREWMDSHPDVGYKIMRRVAGIVASRLDNLSVCMASLVEGDPIQELVYHPPPPALGGGLPAGLEQSQNV
jgi:CRP/FNR family cyclic AMP-dependent transcriptional regulator